MRKPTRQVDGGNLTGLQVIIKSHVRSVVLQVQGKLVSVVVCFFCSFWLCGCRHG